MRRKIGSKQNPTVVVIMTLITCGIGGFVWLVIVSQELRQYKGKEISGWNVLSFIILPHILIAVIAISMNEIAIITSIIILLGLILYLSWRIPRDINKELANYFSVRIYKVLNGSIQILTCISFILGVFLAGSFSGSRIETRIGYILIILSIIFASVWIYLVQRSLNELWDAATGRKAFAIP